MRGFPTRLSATALTALCLLPMATAQGQIAGAGRAELAFPLEVVGWSDTIAEVPTTQGTFGPTAPGSGGGGGVGSGNTTGKVLHMGGLTVPDLSGVGEQVRFVDVLLPDGTTVDLDMTYVSTAGLNFGLHVDGAPAPGLLDQLGLQIYVGHVVGSTQSSASLSFSKYGSRGWIQRDGDLFHLLAQAGPGGNWKQSKSQLVSDATLVAWGNTPQPPCEAGSIPPIQPPAFEQVTGFKPKAPGGKIALSADLLDCSMAIETDDQLYSIFGDLNAEATYVTTLLTWISYRYEEQIQTVLTFPYVMFHTQGTDPWTSQETAGSTTVSLLFELQAAWNQNIPSNAKLGAFLSGAPLGGGVAWSPGLCIPPYNFSVSANIGGSVQFPVMQQSGNWDFIVAAHEIGHNFSAPHTHDWCPPLDECPPSAYFGQCQTVQTCSNAGTVMSYCHLCSPGTANITTYFHPLNVGLMRGWAESNCLPLYARTPEIFCTAKANSMGCMPSIDATGHPTLSGLDNFHITASDVINQQDGLLFFGPVKGSKPFQGGTKCVLSPSWRTLVQNSGGTAVGTNDCSGTFDVQLSHLLFAAKGLGPGTTLYGQYWSLDPQGSFGTSLTDAIKFHLEN